VLVALIPRSLAPSPDDWQPFSSISAGIGDLGTPRLNIGGVIDGPQRPEVNAEGWGGARMVISTA